MKLIQKILIVVLVAGSFACNNDLNEIKVGIKSNAADMPPGLCSMVTLSNQLRTNWRNTNPDKARRKLDLYRVQIDYKVYATEDADPAYKNFVLGNATIPFEQYAGTEQVCNSWYQKKNDDGTYTKTCNGYETVQKYNPIIGFGGSKTINVEFNNMLNQTVKVPSHFLFNLSKMWVKGTTSLGADLSYDNLSYTVQGMLPCFYTHILTLYNARLYSGPEGFQGARVATETEVKDGLDTAVTGVSSFALLTQAERDELRVMNDESTFKRMHAIYLERQSKFSKYLLEATKGKTITGLLADAIKDGRITKSLTLARKSVTGEALDASDVLALFPGAASVIGEELAAGFGAAVAETAALQMSLDQ